MAYAQSTGPVIGNRADVNADTTPSVNVPTVVIKVTQAAPRGFESEAVYKLVNGGEAVSMDPSGDITISAPTDIRFILAPKNGIAYSPVGISFQENGTSDPTGAINFPTRYLAHHVLMVHASDLIHHTTYKYHLVFENPDGEVHILGDGNPTINNK